MLSRGRIAARKELQNRDDFIFTIISEDTYAVQQYFDSLKFSRVKVVTLPTLDKNSSPSHLIDRFKVAKASHDTWEGDEWWICLDTDHWTQGTHLPNFVEALRSAKQGGASVAVSNPCFEMRLFFHVCDDVPSLPTSISSRRITKILKDALGGSYNKTNIPTSEFTKSKAVRAARIAHMLDQDPSDSWPKQCGSYMYRLLLRILRSERPYDSDCDLGDLAELPIQH